MKDQISIIIPCYNISEYIQRCLESVLSQSYRTLEIILVDDGSTDGTSALLDKLAEQDSRIKVIHKENGGVTSARLRGIAESSGDWIGFVDGDDSIEPYMFERLLANARNYHADISHCGYQMVFPDRTDYYYNTGRSVVQNSREALKELIGGSFEPSIWNKIFKKSLINRVLRDNRIDSQIRINEDLLMNYYLFRAADRLVFEDVCPYHYIVRKGSAANSSVKLHHLRDPELVRSTILNDLKDDKELYALSLGCLASHWIRIASLNVGKMDVDLSAYIIETRKKLLLRLHEITGNSRLSLKLKLQAVIAAFAPNLYRGIHGLYGEITGVAHKYDLE